MSINREIRSVLLRQGKSLSSWALSSWARGTPCPPYAYIHAAQTVGAPLGEPLRAKSIIWNIGSS